VLGRSIVTKGALGVAFPAEEDANLLKAYGANQGVFVKTVASGGPAEKAGVKAEDIITAINDKSITKSRELMDEVAKAAIGQTFRVTLVRNRKVVTLSVVVGDRAKIFPDVDAGKVDPPKADTAKSKSDSDADDFFYRFFGRPSAPGPLRTKFEITVKPLADVTPKLDYTGSGIAVIWVGTKSFGGGIGIQRQDIIQSINGQPINTIDDADKAVQSLNEGDSLAIKVMRRDESGSWSTEYVTGALPKAQ
jgi:serine protease Do